MKKQRGITLYLLLYVLFTAARTSGQCTEQKISEKLNEATSSHPQREIREDFYRQRFTGKIQVVTGKNLAKWVKQATSFLGPTPNGDRLPMMYFQPHWVCHASIQDLELALSHQYQHVLDIETQKLPPKLVIPGETPKILTQEQAALAYESEARAHQAECQLAVKIRYAGKWKKECQVYSREGVLAMRQALAERLAKEDARYAPHILVLRRLAGSLAPEVSKR